MAEALTATVGYEPRHAGGYQLRGTEAVKCPSFVSTNDPKRAMSDKGIPNKERILAACLKDGLFGKDLLQHSVCLIPRLGTAVSRPGKVTALRPPDYSVLDARGLCGPIGAGGSSLAEHLDSGVSSWYRAGWHSMVLCPKVAPSS
jgi:hypothetical protein